MLSSSLLTGLLNDHLASLNYHVVEETDASQCAERAGVGILSPRLNLSFSFRLPDVTPIFQAEFLAIVLALKKFPPRYLNVVVGSDCSFVFPLLHPQRIICLFVPSAL